MPSSSEIKSLMDFLSNIKNVNLCDDEESVDLKASVAEAFFYFYRTEVAAVFLVLLTGRLVTVVLCVCAIKRMK